MAEKEYGEMKAIEPNALGHALAKGLRGVKGFLDKGEFVFKPTGGKMGVGELVLGQAPEAIEDWSYGFPPWSGKGQTLTLDPEAIDIATLPTLGAVGLAKSGIRKAPGALSRTLARKVDESANQAVDLERREFLKKAGVVGGAGAAAASIPTVLTKTLMGDAAPAAAAKTTARTAGRVVPDMTKLIRGLKEKVLSHVEERIMKWSPGQDYNMTVRDVEEMENAYKTFLDLPLEKMYSPEKVRLMEDLIKKLPDDVTPEQALLRGWGYDSVPEMQNMGYNRVNLAPGTYSDVVIHTKKLEAHRALSELDPEDIDLWIVSGKRPEGITEEAFGWLDPDDVYDASKTFSGLQDGAGIIPNADPMSNWYDHLTNYRPEVILGSPYIPKQ